MCFRVEGGELFDRVVDPKFDLTERVAILFMRQIVDGLSFIHSQNVIHLDMKVKYNTPVGEIPRVDLTNTHY